MPKKFSKKLMTFYNQNSKIKMPACHRYAQALAGRPVCQSLRLQTLIDGQNEKSKFKDRVYEIVKRIPQGETLTYKKVAKLAGFPQAWRAVGNILNKNRNPEIPCHRVIRSDGKVGGYNKGTKKKIALLKKEGDFNIISND